MSALRASDLMHELLADMRRKLRAPLRGEDKCAQPRAVEV